MDRFRPFYLLHYEKYYTQGFCVFLFSAVFRTFTNLTMTSVSIQYQNAAFCSEHRVGITDTVCV